MTIEVGIVFSSEAEALFQRFGLKNFHVLEDLKTYTFDTEAEAAAFRDGVEEAVGYEECLIKEARPRSKISYIAFGKEESRSCEYSRIDHESAAVRVAYEDGVEAGEGWFGYVDLNEVQMKNYKDAITALLADGKEHNSANLVNYIKSPAQLSG